MEYKEYYKIMGVAHDARQDEIKRAYRKLARKYHPDISKEADAEVHFKEVGEAYEVLKDPEKRAAYDQLGTTWIGGEEFHPPPDWDAGFEFRGGGDTSADSAAFSDFFEELFGRQRATGGSTATGRRAFHLRGENHHAKVKIDLEDSFNGATRPISLQVPELTTDGHVTTRIRTLSVRIPKGIRPGQQIRLTGQGAPGLGDGGAGDLFLEVLFHDHPLYRVEGGNIFLDLPVAPWEIVLGASIKAPTPSGIIDLKIPARSRQGGKLRLKGRGLPGKQPGDMYVILQVVLPDADSDMARNLYKQMEEQLGFNPRATMGVS